MDIDMATSGNFVLAEEIPLAHDQGRPINAAQAPSNESTCDAATKRKLWFILIASIVVIIVVSCVAAAVDYEEAQSSGNAQPWYYPDDEGWGCSGGGGPYVSTVDNGVVGYYCGKDWEFDALNATNCPYLCATTDWYSVTQAFYVPANESCFCFTSDHQYQIDSEYYDQITWETYCDNTTAASVRWYDVSVAYDDCIIYEGRPYFINVSDREHASEKLEAGIAEIECDKYEFSHDTAELNRSLEQYEKAYDETQWLSLALAEHSSIATFNKFALELMSIAAPLWMVESANKAAMDEIKHTRIAFDIVNMMQMRTREKSGRGRGQCVQPDAFPQHQMAIDGDVERIAMDVAIGGCFGETVSALTMRERLRLESPLIAEIAEDEIRHAALAWTVAKWIIDSRALEQGGVTVANREWWHSMLAMKQVQNGGNRVYHEVIPALVDRLWNSNDLDSDQDYRMFYENVVHHLQSNLNSPVSICKL